MSEIEVPNSPGVFISKWRADGPVDDSTLEQWKHEMQIESWLMIAEAALFLDAAELFEQIKPLLTPAEAATIGLVRRRMLGDNKLENAIDEALCEGYIVGVQDAIYSGHLSDHFNLCLAEGVEPDQLRLQLLNFIETNPNIMNFAAEGLVAKSLETTYACKN